MICKVCKRYYTAKKENRYIVLIQKTLSDSIVYREQEILECFDCPKCGCQNIVNIREAKE